MIDPVSAFAIATASYKMLKSAVSAGKELSDMGTTLGSWAGSIADLNYCNEKAKNPSFLKSFSGSPEQEAAVLFANTRKIQEMTKELHVLIRHQYGVQGLEDYLKMTREIREQRKLTAHRKEEFRQSCITSAVAFVAIVIGFAILWGGVSVLLSLDGSA
jgi:hypothetical protein